MFHRLLKYSKSNSFFLFGARGTGKSTYFQTEVKETSFVVSLLEDKWESRYSRNPDLLVADIAAIKSKPFWIIIDEIQKVPKLLDVVHQLIEKKKYKFILTGSSARKLKRESANLLAGRAFNYQMYPLTSAELGDEFDLEFVLQWGALPKIFSLSEVDRNEFLRSYSQTYLKEEILQEQIVRNGMAFRNFLEVAAQENGKCLNFAKLARDLNIDTKTVQSYFQILEDTLVGFFLPAFHQSIRKSVKQQPKFYLFDLGIKRALEQTLSQKILPRTSSFGLAFEHFLICECQRLNSYGRKDFSLTHYQTSAGGEIDLILKRGRQIFAIEIKSTTSVDPVEVRAVARIARALKPERIFFVSQDPVASTIEDVECLHWRDFLQEVFEV
jgi:predicted AAA+ superfamily ATPase